MNDRLSRAETSLAVLLTAAAVALHCIAALSAGALWRDEANTVGLATLPGIREIWNNLQYDSFPAGWILFVRFLAGAAGAMNDPAFRTAGLVIGLTLLGMLWINARVFNYRTPLISLALFALNPSVVRWGDSLRAYGAGMALSILIGITGWRLLEKADTKRFVLAALSAIAGVQVLYYNAPVVLAFCTAGFLCAIAARNYRLAVGVILVGALAAFSLLVYVPVVRGAATWNPLVTIPNYDLSWFSEKLSDAISPAGGWAKAAWMFMTLTAIWLFVRQVVLKPVELLDEDRRKIAFAITALIVVSLSQYLFLKTLSYVTQPWYYLTLLAIVAVTVDIVFGTLMITERMRIARLALAAIIAIVTVIPSTGYVRMRMTNVDVAARAIADEATSEDLVLVVPWYVGVSFDRYYDGAASLITAPNIPFHKYHRYDLIASEMQRSDQAQTLKPVIDQIRTTLLEGKTLFLVSDGPVWKLNEPATLLPPVVIARDGWKAPLYHQQWSAIVGSTLRMHASSISPRILMSTNAVSRYENVNLTVVRGWHD
jgi:hypothetical protein